MFYTQLTENLSMACLPQNLPVRWTTSEGATISTFNQLPRPVLASLGWVPVVYEELPDPEGYKHGLTAVYDPDLQEFRYPAIPRDLDRYKTESLQAIDDAAEAASARHVTVGDGQAMRYLAKAKEAREYADTGENPGPMVLAEADARGVAVPDLVAEIIAQADIWIAVGASIEAARLFGKDQVRSAEDVEAVTAARNSAISSLGLI